MQNDRERSVHCNSGSNDKIRYVETVEPGTLVAFKLDCGEKVVSAKVLNRSTKNRVLKVVTIYGEERIVPFDDVIWVKTGSRWPKGVYELLKGKKAKDGK